jgi:hypothetical protein
MSNRFLDIVSWFTHSSTHESPLPGGTTRQATALLVLTVRKLQAVPQPFMKFFATCGFQKKQ